MQNRWFKAIVTLAVGVLLAGLEWVAEIDTNSLCVTAWAEAKQESNAAPQPKAVFPETKFEVKSVVEGVQITHDFMIENQGPGTLVIERVQPD
ncbi:MAG: hypothetical protein M0036_14015 [Desulfobacteraceae bacterium]|nr:hypothetical protein [Desulfobacteraceae bacterium]